MRKGVLIFLWLIIYSISARASGFTKAYVDSLVRATEKMKDSARKYKNLLELWEVYEHGGKIDSSLIFLKEAYNMEVKRNKPTTLASLMMDFGDSYFDQGAYPQALDSYMDALKLGQQINSSFFISNATCNIGLVYYSMNEADKALDYYNKALKMDEERQDSSNITAAECDIGEVYMEKKNYSEALKYFRMCVGIDEKRNYVLGLGPDYDDMGRVYLEQAKYDSAIIYFTRAINKGISISDVLSVGQYENDLGEAYLKMKKYDEATHVLLKAKQLADTVHSLTNIQKSSQLLSELYAAKGDWQKAYMAFQSYITSKDSLFGVNKSKEIGKVEAKAGYDKQLALQKADDERKEALNEAESKKQKIIIGFVIAIAIAVAILAIIIFRSLKITRSQKEIIEKQKKEVENKKELVEEKNNEILDSITYARRLQDAILPPLQEVKKQLPDSFIMYKPKDIVAGDFYWMQPLDDAVLIAACDCTGHGVPGAMVSVVCSNALNRSVKEFGLTEPGEILDKARELVIQTFEKSEGNIQDGMDISLCSINTKTNEIKWAGAYNPLWYNQNGELKEIIADKQPIGKTENAKRFTTNTLKLNKKDSLYLLTDGYADQFGGEKGKKFKYKQLQQLITGNAQLTMQEQKELLEKNFEQWKGNLEQTDDVCLIGIRL